MRLPIAALAALAFTCLPAVADPVYSPVVDGGSCTAFYIGNDRLLSAGHCGVGIKEVKTSHGRTIKVETIAISDPRAGMSDWQLLEAKGSYVTKDLPAVTLACDYYPEIGDEIRVVGYPEELGEMTVWGHVAGKPAKMGPWKTPVTRADIAISYGNSGSPVFHEGTGHVIGIMVGALPNNRSLTVFTPISDVCHVFNLS